MQSGFTAKKFRKGLEMQPGPGLGAVPSPVDLPSQIHLAAVTLTCTMLPRLRPRAIKICKKSVVYHSSMLEFSGERPIVVFIDFIS